MKLVVLLTIVMVAIVACLPTIANEIPEQEAQGILAERVLEICKDQRASVITSIIAEVKQAEATPARDNWIFKVALPGQNSQYEALVFRSGRVYGSFIEQLVIDTCR